MKYFILPFIILFGFSFKLKAVPANPFLTSFTQPDGSTFKAYLKGDESFSWIETKEKLVLVKSLTSGFFELAKLVKAEGANLELLASGVAYFEGNKFKTELMNKTPNVKLSDLMKIWKHKVNAKKKIKLKSTQNTP